jgi:hypothetical protein
VRGRHIACLAHPEEHTRQAEVLPVAEVVEVGPTAVVARKIVEFAKVEERVSPLPQAGKRATSRLKRQCSRQESSACGSASS